MAREAVKIALKGGEYLMLPTYEAAMAIEDAIAPIGYIYTLHQGFKLDLKSVSGVISIGVAANAGDVANRNEKRTQEMVFETGLADDDLRAAVSEFLLNLLYTPEALAKKREAEAEELAQGNLAMEQVLKVIQSSG